LEIILVRLLLVVFVPIFFIDLLTASALLIERKRKVVKHRLIFQGTRKIDKASAAGIHENRPRGVERQISTGGEAGRTLILLETAVRVIAKLIRQRYRPKCSATTRCRWCGYYFC
jgi:hypothetical protein